LAGGLVGDSGKGNTFQSIRASSLQINEWNGQPSDRLLPKSTEYGVSVSWGVC
jgi:hypothetical protein